MATNTKLLFIFFLYIVAELLFSKIYYSIYENQPENYVFKEAIIKKKIEEVKQSHQRTLQQSSRVQYLEVFQDLLGDTTNFSKDPFRTRLFFKDSLIFVMYFRRPAPPISFYEIEVFNDTSHYITGFRLSEEFDGTNISQLIQKKIDELTQDATSSRKVISRIEANKPFPVWSYWDFLYFSNRKITGEIIPNNTLVRRLATFHNFINILLLGFLINASFGIFQRIKNRNNTSSKD